MCNGQKKLSLLSFQGIDRKEIVTRVRDMSEDGDTLCDALNNVRDEFATEIQDIATILRLTSKLHIITKNTYLSANLINILLFSGRVLMI